MTRSDDTDDPSVEIDIAPSETGGFRWSGAGPEKEMDKGVVRRMRMHPGTAYCSSGVKTERLSLKPIDDVLSFFKRERIRGRNRHPTPSNADKGIAVDELIDLAGITNHGLEASRENVLRVLE